MLKISLFVVLGVVAVLLVAGKHTFKTITINSFLESISNILQ
jgi:hypothetical protein